MFDISFESSPQITEWGEKSILAKIVINDFFRILLYTYFIFG